MPAPSTAAGQTPTTHATASATAHAAALGGPRGRRRTPVLGPAATADPDPGSGRGPTGAPARAGGGAAG
ncbi:glycosyltransferase family 1 protein, partial [Streptomyces sp. NPDC056269]